MFDVTFDHVSSTKLKVLPYSEMHEQHYVSALKMFQSQPIFGVGTNTFRIHCNKEKYKYKENSCTTHPHNYYIQILAELGIFGFLFIITFFIYLSYILIKQFNYLLRKKIKKLIEFKNLIFFIILFIYWWPLIPHMGLYNNWNNVLMMLPLGFFMRYLFSNSNNGNINKI
jgi:O-antigen ligase